MKRKIYTAKPMYVSIKDKWQGYRCNKMFSLTIHFVCFWLLGATQESETSQQVGKESANVLNLFELYLTRQNQADCCTYKTLDSEKLLFQEEVHEFLFMLRRFSEASWCQKKMNSCLT